MNLICLFNAWRIYRKNKEFCIERNITLFQVHKDIMDGWKYPSSHYLYLELRGHKCKFPSFRWKRNIGQIDLIRHPDDNKYFLKKKLEEDAEKRRWVRERNKIREFFEEHRSTEESVDGEYGNPKRKRNKKNRGSSNRSSSSGGGTSSHGGHGSGLF